MTDLVNISVGNAAVTALLGYAVVFLGMVALMLVILLTGKVMHRPKKAAPAPAPAAPAPAAPAAPAPEAPGTARTPETPPWSWPSWQIRLASR